MRTGRGTRLKSALNRSIATNKPFSVEKSLTYQKLSPSSGSKSINSIGSLEPPSPAPPRSSTPVPSTFAPPSPVPPRPSLPVPSTFAPSSPVPPRSSPPVPSTFAPPSPAPPKPIPPVPSTFAPPPCVVSPLSRDLRRVLLTVLSRRIPFIIAQKVLQMKPFVVC